VEALVVMPHELEAQAAQQSMVRLLELQSESAVVEALAQK
jgi:hypothetical protein